jgi:hypothetical protein
MKKKLFILSLSIGVLFLLSVSISSVNAGEKSIPVNWQVAGSIANNVEISINVSTDPCVPDMQTIPHYLISLSAHGSPGPAEITLMGWGMPVPYPCNNCTCTMDCLKLEFQTMQSDMVARFPDQSLLFASYDDQKENYLCLDILAGQSTFVSNMKITGGTGRFEGASGWIEGAGIGYYFSPGALAGEVGELEGEIFLP